jgi:DNA repair photolyase
MQGSLFVLEEPTQGLPERQGQAAVRSIRARQILTRANGSLEGYDYSLNPYSGCGFGCAYCFASFFQDSQDRFESWGSWVEAKENAVELLRAKKDLLGKKIFMSSATDPYQPIEAKCGITRGLLETMVEPGRQPRLVVQTRGPLVARDIDLLKRLKYVRVNMSITTDSDEVRKQFEPGCASIERRLEALRQVKAAGIPTTICILPMLPLEDPERFAKTIRDSGFDFAAAGWFHHSDRAFAASTRDTAWKVAERLGWTRTEYQRTLTALQRYLPSLNCGRGFAPA